MTRVALVTCRRLPQLSPDDHLVEREMRSRGIDVVAVLWDDPSVDWITYDAVVIRSTWDYHKRIDEFRAWLTAMEQAGTKLWNPSPLVQWNVHKSYLAALAAAGIATVPTVLLEDSSHVAKVLAERGWERAVIKPAISATAFQTRIVTPDDVDGPLQRDVLVQPFMEEIVRDGEWSLVFFGETFSHAVRKNPKAGDFRVQSDFGGSATLARASSSLIDQAAAVLSAVRNGCCGDGGKQDWLYARVDGVERDGRLLLMELEMTEPTLFLREHPAAAVKFADAIRARV